MTIQILPSALDDLAAGARFYEKQASGVGEYYLDSLFSDIDSLALYAGIHSRVFGYYRLLAARFPYSIYYTVENSSVLVWRVLDQRRHPSIHRRGLSNIHPGPNDSDAR